MNSNGEPRASEPDPFAMRLRRALSHDLRTPLGTISNYAAILEFQGDSSPEEMRNFAKRIRSSAQRTAETLKDLADALALSARPAKCEDVDVSNVLRSLLAEMSVHARYPAHGTEPAVLARADGELLSYAWRAFLTTATRAETSRSLLVDLEVGDPDRTSITLWIGPADRPSDGGVDAARFVTLGADSSSTNSCIALELAEALVRRRGGILELWGRPGDAAGMRIVAAPR